MTAFWIIDQLVQQGVKQFCIAPGSRCTPLVLAAADHPEASTLVHYDERGLGYYALGHAMGSKKPAAIIVTSGTAVGNLLPCIMEAHHSCIPLIILSADRPAELRDCGANQTTDQLKIFQPFVRWQTDLPVDCTENYFRTTIAQAVFHSLQNPPGPVHINCPFREPFSLTQKGVKGSPIHLSTATLTSPSKRVKASRGVILIGRGANPKPILEMAQRLQWPVFADLLSNARLKPTEEQIRHFDWILKRGCELKPDLILHFGERLTSKKSLDWITQPYIHIGPRPYLIDPVRIVTERIQAHEEIFCPQFEAETDSDWISRWKGADSEIDSLIQEHFKRDFPSTEAHAMRMIGEKLPPTFAVFLGNGMPIRDADHFLFPKNGALGFYSNRGLSGIDGNVATAAGLSDGLNAPVLAFLGDQTCLHDLNSLPLLKNTKYPVVLIASNNFGSGIFSHLPIQKSPHMETFFANAHSYRFEKAAEMYGLPYSNELSFERSCVIELVTNRETNHQFQKELEQCLLYSSTAF